LPDFHQPDDADRRHAEETHAADDAVGDAPEHVELDDLRRHARSLGVANVDTLTKDELIDLLRTERPSSWSDPHGADRPQT
jgi:hypothetical protein